MWKVYSALALVLALAETGISAVPRPTHGLLSTRWDHAARPLRLEARMITGSASGSGSGAGDDRGSGLDAGKDLTKTLTWRGKARVQKKDGSVRSVAKYLGNQNGNWANKRPPDGKEYEGRPLRQKLLGHKHSTQAAREAKAARLAGEAAKATAGPGGSSSQPLLGTAHSRPPSVNMAGQSSASPRFMFLPPPQSTIRRQSGPASLFATNPTTLQSPQQSLRAALTARPSPSPQSSSTSATPAPSRTPSTKLTLAPIWENQSPSPSPHRDG